MNIENKKLELINKFPNGEELYQKSNLFRQMITSLSDYTEYQIIEYLVKEYDMLHTAYSDLVKANSANEDNYVPMNDNRYYFGVDTADKDDSSEPIENTKDGFRYFDSGFLNSSEFQALMEEMKKYYD